MRALTTHFGVTDTLEKFGWLDRELMVPLAGRPLLGCEGGPIVHSFILRGVIDSRDERCWRRSAPAETPFIQASKC